MSINKTSLAGRMWFALKHPIKALRMRQYQITDEGYEMIEYCDKYRLAPPKNLTYKQAQFEKQLEDLWAECSDNPKDDDMQYDANVRTELIDMLFYMLVSAKGGVKNV